MPTLDAEAVVVPRADLPLRKYSAAGLDKRIAALPGSMAAHRTLQGSSPAPYAEPGGEEVLLAERLTGSSRLALPGKSRAHVVLIEASCTENTDIGVTLFDGKGMVIGGAMSTECLPGVPGYFNIGLQEYPVLGQLQLLCAPGSEVRLSLVTYKDLEARQWSG